ncbi:MAG: GAF domain-containing protein, partial [Planctomycetes bacterium]|nr:GAF domain-containing protein [Planctomycetota bacterium]
MARTHHDDLRIVNEFALSMLRQNTLPDLLWSIADNVGRQLGFEDCVVYLRKGDVLVQSAAFGVKNPNAREIKSAIEIPIGRGIVGSVAATGRSRLVADTREDPDYIADEFAGLSELSVPITYHDDVLGVIDTEASRPDRYGAGDERLLQWIANISAPRIAYALADLERRATDHELKQARTDHARSLGELAGRIANDFNNLLLVIHGNLTIAGRAELSDAARTAVDAALRACECAEGLPHELLALARGGAPVIEHGVSVVDLLRESTAFVGSDGKIEFRLELEPELPNVDIDPDQIRVVMTNLLLNAREAMPDGGTVHVHAEAANGDSRTPGLDLLIRDAGEGIDPAALNRVFDPYFTTRSGKAGLGLTIAHRIIVRHGGELSIEHSDATGTVFRIHLPASARSTDRPSDHADSRPTRRPRARHALVMDDQDGVRDLIERMLNHGDVRVSSAANGTEAIELAR